MDCGNLLGSYVQSPVGQVWPMSDYIHLHLLCFFFFQAYSVYDEEIGYCQGQSFLAAVLLLHVSIRFLLRFTHELSQLILALDLRMVLYWFWPDPGA